jgi:lipopolysaccharide/colanic/teichoic acid biosynthesis glycosyltransferase
MDEEDVRGRTARKSAHQRAKRALDVSGAGVLLILSAPVLLGAGAVLALHGGALHRQQRVGKDGKAFTILKLQTMDADGEVTRPGAFLRSTSIDELPQLVNVLLGSMSLVGPRPRLAHEPPSPAVSMAPGLSGPMQVHGRKDLTWEQRDELEAEYCRDWTLKLDVAILLQTPLSVLTRRGAR